MLSAFTYSGAPAGQFLQNVLPLRKINTDIVFSLMSLTLMNSRQASQLQTGAAIDEQ
jgi:hypothetical protein